MARKLKRVGGRFESSIPKINVKRIDKCKDSDAAAADKDSIPLEGRQIIHKETFAEQMFCRNCKSILFLTDVTEEKRNGLASIYYIACRQCHVPAITSVWTDKQHKVSDKKATLI